MKKPATKSVSASAGRRWAGACRSRMTTMPANTRPATTPANCECEAADPMGLQSSVVQADPIMMPGFYRGRATTSARSSRRCHGARVTRTDAAVLFQPIVLRSAAA